MIALARRATTIAGLTLRPWRATDRHALQQAADDPQVVSNLHAIFPHPYTLDDADLWIAACHAPQPNGTLHLAIDWQGQAIGGVGLIGGEDIRCHVAEIGYWLGRQHWGRGFASACVAALMTLAWRRPQRWQRLEAGVLAGNPASMRVLAKAGFVQEGVRRLGVLRRDGVAVDEHVWVAWRAGTALARAPADLPPHARFEIERRWLVRRDPAPLIDVSTRARRIEDRYLDAGRLRLRRIDEAGQPPVFKLNRKLGPDAALRQAVGTLRLDEAGWQLLSALPARVLRKRRFTLAEGSLDVWDEPALDVALFECEYATMAEATAARPPPFVDEEVTGEAAWAAPALLSASDQGR